jgi:hypothetical protein
MMARRNMLGLLFGSAVLLFGCNPLGGGNRYKMTVEVETPSGVKSGYAVREWSTYPRPNGGDGLSVRGEAVAVDIAPGKTLFALLTGADGDVGYAASIAKFALESELSPGGGNINYAPGDFAELYPTYPKTESPIRFSPVPLLVTFKEMRDSKSVVKVEPANLPGAFGPGVRLKRITIKKTREDVTMGIGGRFIWWKKLKSERRRLNGSNSVAVSTNELSDNLGTGDFSTEVGK